MRAVVAHVLVVCLGIACSIDVEDPELFGGSPDGAPEAGSEPASESGDDGSSTPTPDDDDEGGGGTFDVDDAGDASTSGAASVTTDDGAPPPGDDGSADGGVATTSGGSDDAGASGDTAAPVGEQPNEGPWSDCLTAADCGAGMGCVNNGVSGFCSIQCVGFADPSGCPASPGGSAPVGCIVSGGTNVCVLDCSAGGSCPDGMGCVMETADQGLIEICM